MNWINTIYDRCTEGIHLLMGTKEERLYYAIKNNNSKVITAWLKSEATIREREFRLALGESALNGELEMVTTILKYDDNTAAWTFIKNRALAVGAMGGNVDVITKLLERGADIHFGDDCALIESLKSLHFETIVKLLENGANVSTRNDRPLLLGIQAKRLDIIDKLLEYGANVRGTNGRKGQDYIFLRSFWPTHSIVYPEHIITHPVYTMVYSKLDLEIISKLLEYGGNIYCYDKIILKKLQREFNRELALVIFPYCSSEDYHYFPDWFVEENHCATKSAASI